MKQLKFLIGDQFQRKKFKLNQSVSLYFKPRFYINTNKLSVDKLLIHIWEITWFLFRCWKSCCHNIGLIRNHQKVQMCILRVLTVETVMEVYMTMTIVQTHSCWISNSSVFAKVVKNINNHQRNAQNYQGPKQVLYILFLYKEVTTLQTQWKPVF